MTTPLTHPLPAQTGTCPACGEQMGTRDGLARHNLHASAGERIYVGRPHLARIEKKLAAALVLFLGTTVTLEGCGRTITAPDGVTCRRGTVLSAPETLWTATGTVGGIWYRCVGEGR